jgi:DNA-binding FadR family transcriptional regulator
MAVAAATGNDMFPRLLSGAGEALIGTMQMALGLTRVGSEQRRQLVLNEHRQIADAIIAQDSEAAALYMRFHLMRTRARITDAQRDA